MSQLHVVNAGLSDADVQEIAEWAHSGEHAEIGTSTRLRNLRDEVAEALMTNCACVIRGTRFLDSPDLDTARSYVHALSSLFGAVSDNNRFSEKSGTFVDAVEPRHPDGQDLTFRLGECEGHSDESSKILPEDLVFLWCVRPAAAGGTSLMWRAADLETRIRRKPGGPELARTLREPDFLFGGKLRLPRRVLKGPVLFGIDGIRYRLGTIQDGFDAAGIKPTDLQEKALQALAEEISGGPAVHHDLAAGEALVLLNRRTVHARSDFSDIRRLLFRTRCYNPSLSVSEFDPACWLG